MRFRSFGFFVVVLSVFFYSQPGTGGHTCKIARANAGGAQLGIDGGRGVIKFLNSFNSVAPDV